MSTEPIGQIDSILIGGKYLICPDCGRIYEYCDRWNWCPRCYGKHQLKTIRVEIE